MKRILLAVAALGLSAGLGPNSSMSQPAPQPARPGFDLSHEKMEIYCVYASMLYSLGSALCVGKTGYVCVPAETRTNGLGKNRAFWITPDRTAQGYITPNCG